MLNNILRNNGERITLTFKEEFKLSSVITENKRKCRCGHTQLVPRRKDVEFVLCSHCNGRLYADDHKQMVYEKKRDREEFMYKMKGLLDL